MADFRVVRADWAHEQSRLSSVRRSVFIEEQGVPEVLEWDAADADAGTVHLLAIDRDGLAIGCARLLADGHIGRMAVLPGWRGRGVGRALLAAALNAAQARGHRVVKLSAQTHAAGFYARAKFTVVGEAYQEAGIEHVAMEKSLD